MKQHNAALQAVLAAGPPWVMADLFTIVFSNGTTRGTGTASCLQR